MAVTIVVRPESVPAAVAPRDDKSALPNDGPPRELSLTFDAPRLVIGRSEGCEVRLPDPSVSPRHASIRQRGAEYVVLDEGSTNGTLLGKVILPPHSPRVVRSGEFVRVGRVWLEIRIAPAVVQSATAAAARELAIELVSRGLAAQGDDGRPRVFVLEGPDEGKELRLGELGRPYVIGRARECDMLLEDPQASRRHAQIARKGDHLVVRELAQKGDTALEGSPLGPGDTPWRPGQVLALGQNVLIFEYPAAEALAELEQGRDEVMRPGEAVPEPQRPEEPPEKPVDQNVQPVVKASQALPLSVRPVEPTWGLADAAVVLLALGVLALSLVGLWWFLKP